MDEVVAEAARVLLSSNSTLAQKILIDEAVSIVDDASLNGALETLRILLGGVISHLLTDNSPPTDARDAIGVFRIASPT